MAAGAATAQPLRGTSPGPRFGHEMVYDEAREEVILFGGFGPDGMPQGDTWAWNGSAWNRIESQLPSARGFHAMASLPGSDAVVVFGGRNGDELFNYLWAWDGCKWRCMSSDGPVRRGIYASAYDQRRGELIVHGSGDRIGDGWELESETWAWSADTGWRLLASDSLRQAEE